MGIWSAIFGKNTKFAHSLQALEKFPYEIQISDGAIVLNLKI